MDLKVTTLEGKDAGKVSLSDAIFGLEPREDIIARVVRWQLAKKQQGTHQSLTRGEVSRTGAKMYKQKGTGRARHHSARAPQFRGGGKAHGPRARVFSASLNKKVRALGLKMALSSKALGGQLIVVDNLDLKDGKTKELKAKLGGLNLGKSALVIDGDALNVGFARASSNLSNVDLLPAVGANVYDIMRCETLVLTKAAVERLEARFNG
jgi:large subunit ribosomal protein L4